MKYSLSALACIVGMSLSVTAQAGNGVLWRNTLTGANYLYNMDGTGISDKHAVNPVTDVQWKIAAVGDFNGDGESDIVWRHQGSGVNYIYLMKGNVIQAQKQLNVIPNQQWQIVQSADFNQDGKDDLVWRNEQTGDALVYLMDGLSYTKHISLGKIPTVWNLAGAGDFNADGMADILWRNQSNGENKIMLLNNAVLDKWATLATIADQNWKVSAVADFNGDGTSDILWRHSVTGDNYLHTILGAKLQSNTRINSVPSEWKVAAVTDFNGDGKADIFWRNTVTGLNYVYLMNGANIIKQGVVNRIADSNWQVAAAIKTQQSVVVPFAVEIMPHTALNLAADEQFDLSAKAIYSNNVEELDPASAVWSSSNPTVASVDANGLVTGLSNGNASISVTWQNKTDSVDVNVTISEPQTVNVYFKKPSGWNSCYIYYWASVPAGIKSAAWPGEAMQSADDGWCVQAFPAELESVSIVFNDKGAAQTGDFTKISGGCLLDDLKTWVAEGTGVCDFTNGAKVSATPAGGSVFTDQGVQVTLGVSGDGVSGGFYKILTGSQTASAKGGTPYVNGTTLTLADNLAVDTKETLCLYAENTEGVADECFTYTRLEKPAAGTFSWDNATVYFVLTDRFYDADPSNNNSYGRERDQSGNIYQGYQTKAGTFHGGDLKGLTLKLNEGYFSDLGVNAIWITAPYEQIHGYVSGANFKHYAYHGYYALDFSEVDANMGTADDLKTFIDTAHEKGIRVIFDIVMNHAGYDSMYDMNEFGYGTLNSGWQDYYFTANEGNVHYDKAGAFINRDNSASWAKWWGADWLRAGVAGYPSCGSDDLTICTSYLPDFRTENSQEVGIPPILLAKWDSAKKTKEEASLNAFFQRTGKPRIVRNYLIKWLTDWVREYGVDGFRVDTAKHVQMDAWKDLKEQANSAYAEWKKNNPGKWADSQDLPFWMTGEVYDHGVSKDGYFSNGFDSLINFSFQGAAGNVSGWEGLFSGYAQSINNDPSFNVLSYISSHDKGLFDRGNLKNGITALLMVPGAAQIYYGDETGRPQGVPGEQGWRSHMNWDSINQDLLTHAQKLGQFRNRHIAIGAGAHKKLGDSPYYFSRVKDADKVIVALNASGQVSLNVSSVFADGTTLFDAYSNQSVTVSGGSVSLFADGYVLLEEK